MATKVTPNLLVKPTNTFMHLQGQLPNGTSGGSSITGWNNSRIINTEVSNDIPNASMGTNEFTLPAGKYKIKAGAAIAYNNGSRTRLWDVTNNSQLAVGVSSHQFVSSGSSANTLFNSFAYLENIITLSATTSFRVDSFHESAYATQGLGLPSNSGEVEIYVDIFVEKLA